MSERFHLKASWEEVKERLKENDANLSDADLQYEPEREEDLLQRLADRYKKSPEEIRRYIESISENQDLAG